MGWTRPGDVVVVQAHQGEPRSDGELAGAVSAVEFGVEHSELLVGVDVGDEAGPVVPLLQQPCLVDPAAVPLVVPGQGVHTVADAV
jgi:hypothetical protein